MGQKQLKRNAVTKFKIKNGAVTASKINTTGLSVPFATSANTANDAANAANAANAQTAAVANAIGSVTYVKGNVVTAPANGGSGYAESTQSVATCPTGTYVIGTGAYTDVKGIEDSEILGKSGTGSPAPNEVHAYFDNFNNTAYGGNYAEAICAAVHTTSNPGALIKFGAAIR